MAAITAVLSQQFENTALANTLRIKDLELEIQENRAQASVLDRNALLRSLSVQYPEYDSDDAQIEQIDKAIGTPELSRAAQASLLLAKIRILHRNRNASEARLALQQLPTLLSPDDTIVRSSDSMIGDADQDPETSTQNQFGEYEYWRVRLRETPSQQIEAARELLQKPDVVLTSQHRSFLQATCAGGSQAAVETLSAHVANFPRDADARSILAGCYFLRAKHEEFLAEVNVLRILRPSDVPREFHVAMSLAYAGRAELLDTQLASMKSIVEEEGFNNK